jgi:transposase-like protein
MFRFTEEIRRLIYTTNPIESVHRQLRKVTKNRSLFPTDTAILKLLYLATQNVVRKWTVRIPHWNRILAQLSIHFGERVEKYL